MSKKKKNVSQKPATEFSIAPQNRTKSFLDIMQPNNEYKSLYAYAADDIDFAVEIKRSLKEIQQCRKRYPICYVSNSLNPHVSGASIDQTDDLPFSELVKSVPEDVKDVDVIIVTSGGSADQVSKFVETLRQRFSSVAFIVPSVAMSAGTILIMSGDEIVMTPNAHFGPIDPQVLNSQNRFVPAQALLTLIEHVRLEGEEAMQKGRNPSWANVVLLREMDHYNIGYVLNASKYSIDMVASYLERYKFRTWTTHSSSGQPVTDKERRDRARDIAEELGKHDKWLTHSRGINRDMAVHELHLEITSSEDLPGLDEALRRFWALIHWLFENSMTKKIFISEDYNLFRLTGTRRPKETT